MDRDEVEVHKHAKKERGQYPVILTEQSWSIKDLLYDLKHQKMIFDLAGPSEKSERAIWFILPAHGASHIINRGYYTVARRYEFYVRVARTILDIVLATRT